MSHLPPAIINVSVVRGFCPAKCIHCPVGQKRTNKARKNAFGLGFADIEQFPRLLDEIQAMEEPVPTLRFHGVGEPTLWRDLGKALQLCEVRNILTWVFTLGTGPGSTEFLQAVEHASIVEFSINASNPDEFTRTKGMREIQFTSITRNIEKLVRHKEVTGHPNRLLISRVQSPYSDLDSAFLEYWKQSGLADDVFIRSFHDYGGRIEDQDHLLPSLRAKGCLVPDTRMNIDMVLGVVVRCFNELFDTPERIERIAIEKIFAERTLMEIWDGNEMSQWRMNPFVYAQCSTCRSCQPPNPNTSEKQIIQLQN